MNAQLLQALVNGSQPINITISLADLKDVIRTIIHDERRRFEDALAKEHQKPTLNKKQAAKALGVSTSTLDRLCRDGQIISIKIGNAIRFKQSDIDNYLENNRKVTR